MRKREWRPFPEAREFVRSLRLAGVSEWLAYARGDLKHPSGPRPPDIPFNPRRAYRGDGFRGMGDWLGPPPIQPATPGYLDFRRARTFARSLQLASVIQWNRWCEGECPELMPRPANVPEDPAAMYPDAWRGWNDWLGAISSAECRTFRSFVEARAFVRALGLASAKEWRAYCRGRRPDLGSLPDDIPVTPEHIYWSRGWNGYGDWLGTGEIAVTRRPFMDYPDASALVVSLGIRTENAFLAWAHGRRPDLPRRPLNMPSDPAREYASRGWTSWGDFLKTGSVWWGLRRYRPFRRARDFARSLHLGSGKEWRAYCRGLHPGLPAKPEDIPLEVAEYYKTIGWISWGDFLGTGRVSFRRPLRPFRAARKLARSLSLSRVADYRAWLREERPDLPAPPSDMPAAPEGVYRGKGWGGWSDFLGAPLRRRRHMPFPEARRLVRALHLAKGAEYRAYKLGRRPDLPPAPLDLPLAPQAVYLREGWLGWGDFLGGGRCAHREFLAAREFARTLGLRSRAEWFAWSRGVRPDLPPRPPDIPVEASRKYRDQGFTTWADFLGVADRVRR